SLCATDGCGKGYPCAFAIHDLLVQMCVMNSLMCRRKSELNETIHRVVNSRNTLLIWTKIHHFTDDLSSKFMLTEQVAARDTLKCGSFRNSIEQILPEYLFADADW